MRLNIPLLIAGLLALAPSACAPSQPPKRSFAATGPSCTTDSAAKTRLKVLILQKEYKPEIYYTAHPPGAMPLRYRPPQTDPSISLDPSSAMAADLNGAFDNAPLFFKQQLCNLDGIYVNPTGCSSFDGAVCTGFSGGDAAVASNSWGFREGPSIYPPSSVLPLGHRGEYIALSAGPWSRKNVSAPSFTAYEQRLLRQLLPQWPRGKTPPLYGRANPGAETPAMAVLAALAHEYGHILWYDTFRPDGGSYDFGKFCRGAFFDESWEALNGQPAATPPLWRYFGDTTPQLHKNGHVQIGWIKKVIGRGDDLGLNYAAIYLHWYYNLDDRWAGYFATRSPDEDFVETFKFYVLQRSSTPLTSLPIMLRAPDPNDSFNDDVPAQHPIRPQPIGLYETKRDCFTQAFP